MLTVITPAVESFLTLEEAKRHLRVEHGEDDVLIDGLIKAAEGVVAARIQSCLVSTVYDWTLEEWPCEAQIPIGPPGHVTVQSVNYWGLGAVAEAVLSTSVYLVETTCGVPELRLKTGQIWPMLDPDRDAPVRVRFTAGWANAVSVPREIKSAGLLTLGHLYENRQAVVIGGQPAELPLAATYLLALHQWV